MCRPTVTVEPVQDFPALKMTWQHEINAADVAPAFEKIAAALDTTDQPLYVIVDLQNNPEIPLPIMVDEAISLQAWLVVGSNWMARTIEGMLFNMTQRKNVLWFHTEGQALAYLSAVLRI